MAVSLNDVVSANPTDELAGAAPAAAAPVATSPAPAGGEEMEKLELDEDAEIPDEVLGIPSMAGLMRGSPPAIFAKQGEKDPEITLAYQNMKPLAQAGIEFYRGKESGLNAIFNTQFISRKAIEKADKDGKLDQVAAPFAEVKQQFQGLVEQAGANQTPSAEAVTAGAPAPAPTIGAPPADVSQQLSTKRTQNLAPGSPTSGPAPGQGRVLNQILKGAV